MVDETHPNNQQGSHPYGQDAYGQGGPFMDDAPTEVAPSAYAAPAGYESPTQTAGPGYAQQNAQWAGYSSAGQYQSAPQGYATGPQQHYQTTPYGSMPPHAGAQPVAGPPKKNRATGWIIGVILALAAIAGFGLVLFFLPSKSSNTATTSPTTQAKNTATNTAPTSASPTTSDVTDPFPGDASSNCFTGNGVNSLTENEQTFGKISCDFADQITSDARKELSTSPKNSSFTLSSEYSTLATHSYFVSCSNHNHLVKCWTYSKDGTGETLGVYFHDND